MTEQTESVHNKKTFANFVNDNAGLEYGIKGAGLKMSTLGRRFRFSAGLIALIAWSAGFREATAQTWEQVSPTSVARQLDTATLLADGRALIAGGLFLSSAELMRETLGLTRAQQSRLFNYLLEGLSKGVTLKQAMKT